MHPIRASHLNKNRSTCKADLSSHLDCSRLSQCCLPTCNLLACSRSMFMQVYRYSSQESTEQPKCKDLQITLHPIRPYQTQSNLEVRRCRVSVLNRINSTLSLSLFFKGCRLCRRPLESRLSTGESRFGQICGSMTSMTRWFDAFSDSMIRWLDDSMIRCIEPGVMEAGSSDGDFHRFPWNWRICGPRLDFLWFSSIFNDFRWICLDFMDSWGPGSGDVWRDLGTQSRPYK